MLSSVSSVLSVPLAFSAGYRTEPLLLSFYDFDPAAQQSALPGLVDFGIDLPVDCLLNGFYAHGIPSLFRLGRYNLTWGDCWPKTANGSSLLRMNSLPQSRIFAEKGLYEDWQENVELVASMIRPLMDAGVVTGIFLGDEQVCGGHQTMPEVDGVATAFRGALGDDAILYMNECGCDHGPIPKALTYYSIDYYAEGANESAMVKQCYENHVFPNLGNDTKAFVVPGIYGNPDLPADNLTAQEDLLVEKMEAYGQWLTTDDRIAGLNPWHFSTRQNANYPINKYPFGLGAIDFPRVIAILRDIKYFTMNYMD